MDGGDAAARVLADRVPYGVLHPPLSGAEHRGIPALDGLGRSGRGTAARASGLPKSAAAAARASGEAGRPSTTSCRSRTQITVGPAYTGKTLDLCAAGDTICEGTFGGGPTVAHGLYPFNGQVSEGAAYAVSRL